MGTSFAFLRGTSHALRVGQTTVLAVAPVEMASRPSRARTDGSKTRFAPGLPASRKPRFVRSPFGGNELETAEIREQLVRQLSL